MNPLSIYQDRLDVVSSAVLNGDFDTYLRALDLPYLFCTLEADFVLRSPDEVAPVFNGLVAILRRNGVTHYERLAREADLVRPDRIEGWHYSHLIAQGERITAPYAACCALVRRGDRWLVTEAYYPFHTDRLPLSEEVLRAAWRAETGGPPSPASWPKAICPVREARP